MEIDLALYRIFYTVALYKNITKAAAKLYISQPAVTMSIKKLEEELETILFIRTKRGVILTAEGEVLLEYVSQAMENLKAGENKLENMKKLEEGTIRIGIGTTLAKYFLMEYLAKFHQEYPKVAIHINTNMTAKALQDLKNGKIDVAIISTDIQEFSGLEVLYEKEIQDVFIASSKSYPMKGNSIKLEELNQYPLLLQSENSSTRQFLDQFTLKNGIKLNCAMDLASYSLVIEFAKIGMGIGFVTKDYITKELKNKELVEVKVTPSIPKRKILILKKENYLLSYGIAKLMEFIQGEKK